VDAVSGVAAGDAGGDGAPDVDGDVVCGVARDVDGTVSVELAGVGTGDADDAGDAGATAGPVTCEAHAPSTASSGMTTRRRPFTGTG
jgi:hypothetical protein